MIICLSCGIPLTIPPEITKNDRIRSVLKYLSAIWPAIKGAAIAPIEPARPNIIPICDPVNPSPPSEILADKYLAVTGSQAPHKAY